MGISKKDVEHVAWLARLGLSDEEKERFTVQLGSILEYAERVGEVDTSGVEPMAHATTLTNVFRDDVPTPSLERDEALGSAPEAEDGGFSVPRIV